MTTRQCCLALVTLSLVTTIGRAQSVPVPVPVAPSAAPPPASASTNGIGAKIQFATPVYDFGKAKAGDAVHYTYVFTNSGDQTLEVKSVQPSCGCTTAGDWTKRVEPGKTGNVPIQFSTGNYNGQVFKTISVTSNAKDQPTTVLQLKGTVWKPIELSPPYTVLTIPPDAPATSVNVRVINNMETPVQIWQPESSNPTFTAELKTNQPGKEYQVTISSSPPFNPGSITAKVTVKTSATNTPVLEIPFWANIQSAVLVMPAQIMLPRPPLDARATPSITIQNNSTNALTLTDPKVNAPGVEVKVNEIQPGRVFTVALAFPQGYEAPADQAVELTLKSSNPHVPLIKVPIKQMAKPAAPPTIPVAIPAKTPPPGITVPIPAKAPPPPPLPPKPTTQAAQ